MSTATAEPTTAPATTQGKTTSLVRLTGVNVEQDAKGRAVIRFSDVYKFPDNPRYFKLVDMTAERVAASTESGKRLPQWDVHVVLPGGAMVEKPCAGAWEAQALDRTGKPHGRINFTDPYTHRRYVLFVYSEPQPTPNGGAMFHGSASVDMSTFAPGSAVNQVLSRFGGRAAVPVAATKPAEGQDSQGGAPPADSAPDGQDDGVIPF